MRFIRHSHCALESPDASQKKRRDYRHRGCGWDGWVDGMGRWWGAREPFLWARGGERNWKKQRKEKKLYEVRREFGQDSKRQAVKRNETWLRDIKQEDREWEGGPACAVRKRIYESCNAGNGREEVVTEWKSGAAKRRDKQPGGVPWCHKMPAVCHCSLSPLIIAPCELSLCLLPDTHTHLYNPPPSLQHVHWLLGSPLLVFMSLGADSKWNIYCPLVGMTASMSVHVQICAAGSCAHVHTNQAWQVPIKQSCFYESYPPAL